MPMWDWEPDDFAALWLGDAHDRFPHPFSYTSRFPGMNEVAAHRDSVRARYDRDEAGAIHLAFHTLDTSELRIVVLGESRTLGKGKPREYRILAARNAFHAVMVTQTAADGVDGNIRCHRFGTDQLPSRLARMLPPFKPGSAAPETIHIDDFRNPQPAAGFSRTPRERFQRLTSGRIDGAAGAGLFTGPLTDDPAPWFEAQWFDIKGDGRYLKQRTREHLKVRPAGPAELTTVFESWIQTAWKRLHEDEYQPW
ncbi:MAG: ESX secretion-associated protein EspG [Nocardia sp.]|nr:ESX secretion-associated protein EspG [Nocardia sp.]